MPWDLVVIDEAHRLRNAYKPSNKMARALRLALQDRPKLLLTATPLQNDLLELFGLLSFLDESILGPEHAFRSQYLKDSSGLDETAAEEIRARLAPAVQRTLRRQVREYVRFTKRRSVVEDFAPSLDEQRLYDQVSEYLRRSEALALEPGQKTLLTLVYRKLLASSTFAIAPTLRKLAAGLRKRLEAAKLGAQADLLLPPDEASQYSEEAEEWASEGARPSSLKALVSELHELECYAEQAERIRVNAKGEALLRALQRVFEVARQQDWPQKAVVFTESKRTQEYLARLLSDAGYAGLISTLSGDASTPEARRELVEEFRTKTQILLSTEAGAEGLNLQFCNLVVNYDLPWNPQRIEQRIGRCHRYGQARDVLVLNFLNRHNAADARLLELLEQKLHLFDGVFGASDEILGALENGVDFERRVLNIYQECRSTQEINSAFDALRGELESHIDDRMKATRGLLLERFDGDVRRRLRLAGEQLQAALTVRRGRVQALQESGATPESARAVRELPAEPVAYLELDGSALPTRLAHLHGKDGWWFVYRFELAGAEREEKLLHLVLLREGQGFRALLSPDAECFGELPARAARGRMPAALSVATQQADALEGLRRAARRDAELRVQTESERLRERADRYAEECLAEPREALEQARAAWDAQRRALAPLAMEERGPARAEAERLEREYRRRLTTLRNQEEKRYAAKDRQLAMHGEKLKLQDSRTLVASAYFWLT